MLFNYQSLFNTLKVVLHPSFGLSAHETSVKEQAESQ